MGVLRTARGSSRMVSEARAAAGTGARGAGVPASRPYPRPARVRCIPIELPARAEVRARAGRAAGARQVLHLAAPRALPALAGLSDPRLQRRREAAQRA